MIKLLVITSNLHFLDFIKFLPYQKKIFYIDLNKRLVEKAFFYLTLKHRLKYLSLRYDIIFCDWYHKFATLMSHVSSKPIFIRLHRSEIDEPFNIQKANFQNIKGIITVSQQYKNNLMQLIGDKTKIHVIYNGVDPEKFSFNPKINRPLKICSLGNLNSRKRTFDLIVNNPQLKLDIGGQGEGKRILEQTIKKFTLKAKLHNYVDLPKFYHEHDIFIHNSMDEGCCVSLLEAMSCGLIPLCFEYPGIIEIIPKEFTFRQYKELENKIIKLNEKSDTEILSIKRQFREIIQKRFDLQTQAKNFSNFFER